MHIPSQIAKHLREVYFGGNWTASNLKEQLADISWQEATTQVHNLNTIATLVNHMSYYVPAVAKVLEGGPLEAKDKYSFTHPPIRNQEDWNHFLEQRWKDAEHFARLIEQVSPEKLGTTFIEEKYGIYFHNLFGIIEHLHYHLGQIVIIKKLLRQQSDN